MIVTKPLIGLLALELAAGALTACRQADHAPQGHAEEPVAVSVVPVVTADIADRLEAGGAVAAPESAAVSSRILATIDRVRVKAGDRVRSGELLLTLDARDVMAHARQARASSLAAEKALVQARTEHSAAEADHRLAASWHKRIAALHVRNSATDHERDEAEARLGAAAARLDGAQAGIDAADARLASARAAVDVATATESFATVRAPFDGVVTERLVDAGTLAAPGVPLLRIDSDGARQVIVRVDEARAAYVHVGDPVHVEIDTSGEGTADAKDLEGVVAEVARAIGTDHRTFTVKVTVPPAVTARSGSFARVVFRGAPRRALLVPAAAIQRRGQVSSVYVVRDGVALLRLVQLGNATSAGVEVLAGLDGGESIAISPLERLADGSTVSIGGASARTGGTP